MSTADFESARRGSTPRRGTETKSLSSECAGFARDPAKVEDQVQFLARTFTIDAGARRLRRLPAKQLEVGSTPVSVSDQPTAGLDYIIL